MRYLVGSETQQAAGRLITRNIAQAVKKGAAFLTRDTFLILLLAVTFVSGVFWAAVIPIWQIPDEPAHYGYIQALGEDFSLLPPQELRLSREIGVVDDLTGLGAVPFHNDVTQPFTGRSRQGPQEEEVRELPRSLRVQDIVSSSNPAASYPSGYYFPASLIYRLLGSQDVLTIMFGLRIFSAFLTTVTMLFSYLTLKRFFRDEATARATALIIAFSPMYIYMGMAVNVDVLVWLFFSIYLYLLTRAFTDGLSMRLNLLLALTVALGLWVKQTFLLAIPFYLILLAFLNLRGMLTPGRAVVPVLVFFATIAALDGWLYLGDFIRTSATYGGGGETKERSVLGFIQHFRDSWPRYRWTFDTFWGNFGWLDTPLSQRSYDFLRWGSAVAAAGLVLYFITSTIRRKLDALPLFYLALSVTFIASLTLVNYINITKGGDWLLQGRYFFPIIVPIIALQVRGLTSWVSVRPLRDFVLLGLVIGIVLFQVDVLFRYVLPRYYL